MGFLSDLLWHSWLSEKRPERAAVSRAQLFEQAEARKRAESARAKADAAQCELVAKYAARIESDPSGLIRELVGAHPARIHRDAFALIHQSGDAFPEFRDRITEAVSARDAERAKLAKGN